MARIKQPDLPDGALKEFFASLHDLHLKAGYSSTREIQKDIGRNVVSHTTIHKALGGPHLPGWDIVELIIEVLSRRSRLDEDATVEEFRSIWGEAAKQNSASPGAGLDEVRKVTPKVSSDAGKSAARSFAELMPSTLDVIEAAGIREITSGLVPTGLADLDALTGGLRPGSLIVIGACPSIGKSTLVITMCATSAIRFELPTALFSAEMSEHEIIMRILSAESRVAHVALRGGMMSVDDWSRLARRMSQTADAPFWLTYSPELAVENLETQAKLLHAERRLKLLAIDNVNSMAGSAEEAREVWLRLKTLAVDLSIPILATTNTRKRLKDGMYERPRVDDLWGAEAIESIADMIILLDRPDYYEFESPRAGEIDLIVARNRFGPTVTMSMAFQGHYCRIVDLFISEEQGPAWSSKVDKKADTDDNSGEAKELDIGDAST